MTKEMSKDMAVAILSQIQYMPRVIGPDDSRTSLKDRDMVARMTNQGKLQGSGKDDLLLETQLALAVLGIVHTSSDTQIYHGGDLIMGRYYSDKPIEGGGYVDDTKSGDKLASQGAFKVQAFFTNAGHINQAGVKFLLEAGVKNPVLEVLAKELGIEVQTSHVQKVRGSS